MTHLLRRIWRSGWGESVARGWRGREPGRAFRSWKTGKGPANHANGREWKREKYEGIQKP